MVEEPDNQVVCRIAFMVDDSRSSITQLLRLLAPFSQAGGQPKWTLDASQSQYLGPDAAVMLLAAVLMARHRGQHVTVRLPTEPESLRAFCAFSGLRHWMNGEAHPDSGHPKNVTIPLRVIEHASFRDADPLIDLVMRQTGISDESAEYLRLCVNEVTQNIEDHAESPIGGVFCARYMKVSSEVRVAIVDRGIGIATSLRRRYPNISSGAEALSRVIAGGYTTRSRPNNAGLGLSHLWNSVGRLKGSVLIISEDGLLGRHPDRARTMAAPLDPPFEGTGLFFTLPVQTGPQFKESYD